MAIGSVGTPRAAAVLTGVWLAAALNLAAAGAEDAPPIDEARVEGVLSACGDRDAEALLAERLRTHGVTAPSTGGGERLDLAVHRAVEPAERPESTRAALLSLMAEEPGDAAALRYYVLKNMAYYQALSCHALRQWYRHFLVYRDLREGAAEGTPDRGYFERSTILYQTKLAVSLRAHRRLAEKEHMALTAVGLEDGD